MESLERHSESEKGKVLESREQSHARSLTQSVTLSQNLFEKVDAQNRRS